MILRPFQERALAATRELIRCGKRAPLIVCPTGGGKTCMGSAIAHRHIERGGDRRVVVTREPLDELHPQAANRYARAALPESTLVRDAASKPSVSSAMCCPEFGHNVTLCG